jgi:hypothetical protein
MFWQGSAGQKTHAASKCAVLPTLPIWVSPDLMIPLELEATYEETCRVTADSLKQHLRAGAGRLGTARRRG